MEFKNEAHKAIYEKVGKYVKELFGELVRPRDDFPAYYLMMGTAVVYASVLWWGDNDAIINVRSFVVTGAEKTPEMFEFLLRQNYDMRFGGFSMDQDGDIVFEHTIVGSTCDKEELRTSIMTVLSTADQYDDQIVSRWGGKRAMDRT